MAKEKKQKENTVEEISTNKNDSLIISPRLTEKASNLSSLNIYTFNVSSKATKEGIKKEVEAKFKVKPVKITVSNNPRVKVFSRGKIGYKSGFKKAQVFLKKGDTINLA